LYFLDNLIQNTSKLNLAHLHYSVRLTIWYGVQQTGFWPISEQISLILLWLLKVTSTFYIISENCVFPALQVFNTCKQIIYTGKNCVFQHCKFSTTVNPLLLSCQNSIIYKILHKVCEESLWIQICMICWAKEVLHLTIKSIPKRRCTTTKAL
jgi:hypothetical protein